MELNKYQTPLTEELLSTLPEEVRDQLMDMVNNIAFVRNLISPHRQYAKDRPRDSKGRIIVDLVNPHILEDMDYFRPTALHYEKYGTLTDLKPNANPNSAFGKWIREERRRIWEGYVREEDGEWVTGYMYWYLNYCPIMLSKIRKYKDKDGNIVESKRADRVEAMPEFWEGIYWRFHYIDQASNNGKHCAELAARGKSKSYSLAAILSHIFILGENEEAHEKVKGIVTASQKEYLTKDGVLNKFVDMINFCATSTQFPRRRLKSSLQEMTWIMGYRDVEMDIERGTQNTVLGVSSKDDESKLRGKRAAKILVEEMGSFPRLLDMYNNLLPSVQEGDIVFGQLILVGTAGDNQSDFAGAQEILYNPVGYNMYSLQNVYDKFNQGKPRFTFFFPGYVNRKGCYNKDGVSDVIKALIQILLDRHRVKYNSTDPDTILRTIAETPITPAEAIIKPGVNMFPVSECTERVLQLDSNPSEFDDVYTGELVMEKSGEVVFKPSSAQPIREFPLKDNRNEGAVEIFQMPEIDKATGRPYGNRYIGGSDPIDTDGAETSSLGSIFILDLWTDRIVAEYTGRSMFVDDYFEICRLICLFFNARLNYEAHPYDQEVHTPSGVKQWKDICVGDKLFAPNGKTVTVVNIPMEGEDDIYKITLTDGRTVEASSNHIWKINKLNTKTFEELTTVQLFETGAINKFNQHNFFIPEAGAVDYPKQEVPIEPYTMGLLLAEGAFTKFKKNKVNKKARNYIQFSSSKEDALFYSQVLPYPIKYIGTKGYSFHLYMDNIDKILESLGLLFKNSYTKFIPAIYLYNDRDTRLELLRGLMDGDGCTVSRGGSIFTSVSTQLIKDVSSLCRSLGFKVSGHYNNGKQIRISTQQSIFKLPRKKEKQYVYKIHQRGSKATALFEKTAIEKITYIGRKPCKCVTVDNTDGLYLIGDYVVTHNCNKKGLFSYLAARNCTYLLTDTLEFLKDKQLAKEGWGNKQKGTVATAAVNSYARTLLRNWLLGPVPQIQKIDGEEQEVMVSRLFTLRSRALLKELINYNSEGNFDRISAMGMLLLLREEKMILYQGDMSKEKSDKYRSDYLGNDPFFSKNYKDSYTNQNKKLYLY